MLKNTWGPRSRGGVNRRYAGQATAPRGKKSEEFIFGEKNLKRSEGKFEETLFKIYFHLKLMSWEGYHQPVLLKEVLEWLPSKLEVGFDGTLGHWGHTQAILEAREDIKKWFGVDKDKQMLQKAQKRLKQFWNKIKFVHGSYADLEQILGDEKVDWMLLDLGVNMEHFKDWGRWFSIKQDWELDMRFDTTKGKPAWQAIGQWQFEEFASGLLQYWDFGPKFAKWIAGEILQQRRKKPLKTTMELKQFLKNLGLGEKKIAVIFQVLRIMVNNELGELKRFLSKFVDFLNPGWRVAVISYHSGEDRLVKEAFKDLESKGLVKILTKKVVKPSWQEITTNKAARSARMRVVER